MLQTHRPLARGFPKMKTEMISQDKAKALEADEAFNAALRRQEIGWVQLAIMAKNIRDREYYKYLGFDHFKDWMHARADESRGSLYGKIDIVSRLLETIPVSVIQTIPITNCRRLLKATPKQRERLIDKARTMSIVDFAQVVRESKGNSLNGEEDKFPVTFTFTAKGKATVDEAIRKVWDAEGACSKGEALEMICADFNGGH